MLGHGGVPRVGVVLPLVVAVGSGVVEVDLGGVGVEAGYVGGGVEGGVVGLVVGEFAGGGVGFGDVGAVKEEVEAAVAHVGLGAAFSGGEGGVAL